MRCPSCKTPTKPSLYAGVQEFACPTCGGIWISESALQRLIRRHPAAAPGAGEALPDRAAVVASSNNPGPVICPDCHSQMTKDRVHPRIPVQIDRCEKCRYIWLDPGEQDLLLHLYQELATSRDPAITAQREKLQRLAELRGRTLPGMAELDRALSHIQHGVEHAAGHWTYWRDPSADDSLIERTFDGVLNFLFPS